MKQPENAGTTIDLMKYRLEKAESDIKSAKVLIEAEEYMGGQITGHIMRFFMPYPLFMPSTGKHTRSTRTQSGTSIRIM